MKNGWFIVIGIVVLITAFWSFRQRPVRFDSRPKELELTLPSSQSSRIPEAPPKNVAKSTTEPTLSSSPAIISEEKPVIKNYLARNNFESLVPKCFEGDTCAFSEDPRRIYNEFKQAGNRTAIDQLISFLRKGMSDSVTRGRYSESLLKMIEDFYSAEEKQFQLAAYYNYLGSLERSLELYLDLETRASKDPSLRGAPKLNVANTYYDLKRFKEAVPYYKAAKTQYETHDSSGSIPNTNLILAFIESRLEEIAKRNDTASGK